MRHTAVIHKGHGFVRITDFNPEMIDKVLYPFCRKFFFKLGREPIPGTRKAKTVVTHVFARFNNDRTELRFSAGALKDFYQFVDNYTGYDKSRFLVKEIPEIEGQDVEFKWRPGWGGFREGQQEWCEYQLEDGAIKVNNGPTGFGKSFCATHTAVNMGKRTVITTLPRYMPIWIKSFGDAVELTPDEFIVLEKGSLEDLAENIATGKINPKVIIIPLSKIDVYLKRMRTEDDLPDLDEIYTKINAGLRIIDEGHESIYSVYMSLLYGNMKKTLALSATLKADDQLTNVVYGWVYPKEIRFKEPEQRKYIQVVACHHYIDTFKYKINSKGFGGYNHVKFEQSIMRNPKVLYQYYQLVKQVFDEFYMDDYLEGQKCLIFFATVEMCVYIVDRLKIDYEGLDVTKFSNEESSNKETKFAYMEHRVVVTTPQSCGTGKDIPMLFTVISPYCVSSMQRNAQMLGRTRPVDKWWPTLSPYFVYFVCDSIPKQVEYHRKRRMEFENKSLSQTNYVSGHSIY